MWLQQRHFQNRRENMVKQQASLSPLTMHFICILILLAGIAIGLAVMLIAVAIVLGFKREVRDKIVGFGSHIQLTNLDAAYGDNMLPLSVSDSLWQALAHDPEFKHVQRYSVIPGIVNTAESFRGMMLKGIGEEYDTSFFRKCLVEGEIPVFSDSLSSNQVVISKSMADALKLKIGDKIDTYYVQNENHPNVDIQNIQPCEYLRIEHLHILHTVTGT